MGRTAVTRARLALMVSCAVAALGTGARGQNIPRGGSLAAGITIKVGLDGAAPATVTGTGLTGPGQIVGALPVINAVAGAGNVNNLRLEVTRANTVVNWNGFDIAGTRAGGGAGVRSVTFGVAPAADRVAGFAAGGPYAVLNRVIGTAPAASQIFGALTAEGQGTILLYNPNGIVFGGTSVVNTSTFVATALDFVGGTGIGDDRQVAFDSFTSASFRLQARTDTAATPFSQANPGSTAQILVNAGAKLNGGGTLLLVAPQISSAAGLTGGDDGTVAHLPTGDVVLVTAADATVQLNAGSLVNVKVGVGSAVATTPILSSTGAISARNIYAVAVPTTATTAALLKIDGTLTATSAVATEGGIVLTAGAAVPGFVSVTTPAPSGVAVTGTVTGSGAYTVSGAAVTLGKAATMVTQSVDGTVTITSTDPASDVSLPGTIGLRAGAAGSGTPLTITSARGLQGATATLSGGDTAGGRQSPVVLSLGAGGALSLGGVDAKGLTDGTPGGALTLPVGGSIGTVRIADPLDLRATTGNLAFGSVRSDGAINLASMAGTLTLTGPLQSGASASLFASGAVGTQAVTSGGTATITSGGGTVTIAGVLDSQTGANITAATAAAVTSGVTVHAGDYSVSGNSVALGGTAQSATGAVTITATGSTITGSSGLVLRANSDGAGAETLALSAKTDVVAGGATFAAGSLGAGGAEGRQSPITVAAGGAVTLGQIDAAALAVGDGAPVGSIALNGPVTVANGALLFANGAIQTGTLTSTSGGAIDLTGAQVTVAATAPETLGAVTATGTAPGSGFVALSTSVGALTVNGPVDAQSYVKLIDSAAGAPLSAAAVTARGGAITIASAGDATLTGPAMASGDLTIKSTGAASAIDLTSGGSARVTATGAATVTGNVSVTGAAGAGSGNYSVTGASVLLGAGAATRKQSATGDVTIMAGAAPAGGVEVDSGLTLVADSGAARGHTLTIDAGGGAIASEMGAMSGATLSSGFLAGAAPLSDVRLGGTGVTLGEIEAKTLRSILPGTGLTVAGPVTLGAVVVNDPAGLAITSKGDLIAASLWNKGGAVSAAATTGGKVDVTGTAQVLAGFDITITGATSAHLNTAIASGNVTVTAMAGDAALDVATTSAGLTPNNVTVRASGGKATLGKVDALGSVLVRAEGHDATLGKGTAKGNVLVDAGSGAAVLGTAGGPKVTAQNITGLGGTVDVAGPLGAAQDIVLVASGADAMGVAALRVDGALMTTGTGGTAGPVLNAAGGTVDDFTTNPLTALAHSGDSAIVLRSNMGSIAVGQALTSTGALDIAANVGVTFAPKTVAQANGLITVRALGGDIVLDDGAMLSANADAMQTRMLDEGLTLDATGSIMGAAATVAAARSAALIADAQPAVTITAGKAVQLGTVVGGDVAVSAGGATATGGVADIGSLTAARDVTITAADYARIGALVVSGKDVLPSMGAFGNVSIAGTTVSLGSARGTDGGVVGSVNLKAAGGGTALASCADGFVCVPGVGDGKPDIDAAGNILVRAKSGVTAAVLAAGGTVPALHGGAVPEPGTIDIDTRAGQAALGSATAAGNLYVTGDSVQVSTLGKAADDVVLVSRNGGVDASGALLAAGQGAQRETQHTDADTLLRLDADTVDGNTIGDPTKAGSPPFNRLVGNNVLIAASGDANLGQGQAVQDVRIVAGGAVTVGAGGAAAGRDLLLLAGAPLLAGDPLRAGGNIVATTGPLQAGDDVVAIAGGRIDIGTVTITAGGPGDGGTDAGGILLDASGAQVRDAYAWHGHKFVDMLAGSNIVLAATTGVSAVSLGETGAVPATVRAVTASGDARVTGAKAANLILVGTRGIDTMSSADAMLHNGVSGADIIVSAPRPAAIGVVAGTATLDTGRADHDILVRAGGDATVVTGSAGENIFVLAGGDAVVTNATTRGVPDSKMASALMLDEDGVKITSAVTGLVIDRIDGSNILVEAGRNATVTSADAMTSGSTAVRRDIRIGALGDATLGTGMAESDVIVQAGGTATVLTGATAGRDVTLLGGVFDVAPPAVLPKSKVDASAATLTAGDDVAAIAYGGDATLLRAKTTGMGPDAQGGNDATPLTDLAFQPLVRPGSKDPLASLAGSNILIAASGMATVTDALTAYRDLSVFGQQGVTLGVAGTAITDQANGRVRIETDLASTAVPATIALLGNLSVISNADRTGAAVARADGVGTSEDLIVRGAGFTLAGATLSPTGTTLQPGGDRATLWAKRSPGDTLANQGVVRIAGARSVALGTIDSATLTLSAQDVIAIDTVVANGGASLTTTGPASTLTLATARFVAAGRGDPDAVPLMSAAEQAAVDLTLTGGALVSLGQTDPASDGLIRDVTLVATNGPAMLGSGVAHRNLVVRALTDATVTSGTAQTGDVTVTATNGTAMVGSAMATAGNVGVTAGGDADVSAVAGRDVTVVAGANANVTADAGGNVGVTAGVDADVSAIATTGDVTVRAGRNAGVGAVAGRDVSVVAGADVAVAAHAGRDLAVDAGGAVTLGAGFAGTAYLRAGMRGVVDAVAGRDVLVNRAGGAPDKTATLGTLGAGRDVLLSVGDLVVQGSLTAADRIAVQAGAGVGTITLGAANAFLSNDELKLIHTPTLSIDGGARDLAFADTMINPKTVTSAFSARTTGMIMVIGPVVATSTASFTLGDAGAPASRIAVIPGRGAAGDGGSIDVGANSLFLKADRIVVGQLAASQDPNVVGNFEGAILAGAGLSRADVATRFVQNAASTLYKAAPAYAGADETPSRVLLRAGTLDLTARDYALVQNTNANPQPGGGIDVGKLSVHAIDPLGGTGPNALGPLIAVFGNINGQSGSGAAVQPLGKLDLNGISPTSVRVNGCVAGQSTGCIVNVNTTPPIGQLNPASALLIVDAPTGPLTLDLVSGAANEALWLGDVSDDEREPSTKKANATVRNKR